MKITTMMDIDDDGPYRRKRRVQHQNSDFSRKMTKSLFNFVRRGQIKDAIKMCELCDEPWQSAGLYGYLEHNKGLKGTSISVVQREVAKLLTDICTFTCCLADESGILHLKDLTSTEATARNLWRISCNQIARDVSCVIHDIWLRVGTEHAANKIENCRAPRICMSEQPMQLFVVTWKM